MKFLFMMAMIVVSSSLLAAGPANFPAGTTIRFKRAINVGVCGPDNQFWIRAGKVECSDSPISNACLVTATYNLNAGRVCTVISPKVNRDLHEFDLSPTVTCPIVTCQSGTFTSMFYDRLDANAMKEIFGGLADVSIADEIDLSDLPGIDSTGRSHSPKHLDNGGLIIRDRRHRAIGN